MTIRRVRSSQTPPVAPSIQTLAKVKDWNNSPAFCTIHKKALVREREAKTFSSVANTAANLYQPRFLILPLMQIQETLCYSNIQMIPCQINCTK